MCQGTTVAHNTHEQAVPTLTNVSLWTEFAIHFVPFPLRKWLLVQMGDSTFQQNAQSHLANYFLKQVRRLISATLMPRPTQGSILSFQ